MRHKTQSRAGETHAIEDQWVFLVFEISRSLLSGNCSSAAEGRGAASPVIPVPHISAFWVWVSLAARFVSNKLYLNDRFLALFVRDIDRWLTRGRIHVQTWMAFYQWHSTNMTFHQWHSTNMTFHQWHFTNDIPPITFYPPMTFHQWHSAHQWHSTNDIPRMTVVVPGQIYFQFPVGFQPEMWRLVAPGLKGIHHIPVVLSCLSTVWTFLC